MNNILEEYHINIAIRTNLNKGNFNGINKRNLNKPKANNE